MYEVRRQEDDNWVIFADGKALMICVRESDAIKAVQEAQQLLSASASRHPLGESPAVAGESATARRPERHNVARSMGIMGFAESREHPDE